MRPIDADVLVKKFEALKKWETLFNTYGTAILEINNMPTLDVKPVKHAHWVESEEGYFNCSNCHNDAMIELYENSQKLTPFCPNCGAKMDEEV